jgi:hypothetical protein
VIKAIKEMSVPPMVAAITPNRGPWCCGQAAERRPGKTLALRDRLINRAENNGGSLQMGAAPSFGQNILNYCGREQHLNH